MAATASSKIRWRMEFVVGIALLYAELFDAQAGNCTSNDQLLNF
jgi:hypothetical protein